MDNENISVPSSGGAVAIEIAEPPKRDWYKTISRMGEILFSAAKSVVWTVVYSILWLIAAFLRGWERVVRFFKKNASTFTAPFVRYAKALKMNRAEIAAAKNRNGFIGAAGATARVTQRLLFGKRGIIITAANWILPILSCIFLFKVIAYAHSQTFALKLTVNGDFIGYIEDETVFTDAENVVQKRINYSGSRTDIINFEPAYELDTIGGSTLTVYQAADKLLSLVSKDIDRGYGLYIGGEYFGTLTEHANVDEALEGMLAQYRSDSEKESVRFEKDISYVEGMFMKDSFVEENDMISTLTAKKKTATFYTVEAGDSPASIASKVGMSLEELGRLNNGFSLSTAVHIGDQIKITQDVPFLSVMITREEHYTEPIEFETEKTNDSSLYAGFSYIDQTGVNGETAITANVSYVNGVEVSRVILSTVVTQKPVTEYILVGTTPRPSTAGPPKTVLEGYFYWPVGGSNGGTVSQLPDTYGGYGGHHGFDIAAPYGTPIYAGANGTIISISSDKLGGNWIRIRHDNGYVTYYGHLSSYASTAKVGQRVTMGDVIGYVGRTGTATGNHCHFQVELNGKILDPTKFLEKHATQPGVYQYWLQK